MTSQELLVRHSIQPAGPLRVGSNFNMNYVNIGALSLTDATFDKVEFEDTMMPKTRFSASIFRDCIFTKVVFESTLFDDSKLEGCRFVLNETSKKSIVFANTIIRDTSITTQAELGQQKTGIDFINCTTLSCSTLGSNGGGNWREEFTTYYLLLMSYKEDHEFESTQLKPLDFHACADTLDRILHEWAKDKRASKEDVIEHTYQSLLHKWNPQQISRQVIELIFSTAHGAEWSLSAAFMDWTRNYGLRRKNNEAVKLSEMSLKESRFNGLLAFNSFIATEVKFNSCSFDNSTMINSSFLKCSFTGARSSFSNTIFDYSKFENCVFEATRRKELLLKNVFFHMAEFSNCYFKCVQFEEVDLRETNVFDQDLTQCRFVKCIINLEQVKTSAKFISCSFSQNYVVMNGKHFGDADFEFSGCEFESITIIDATFRKGRLKNCTFRNCTFKHVSFEWCDLTGTVFDNCKFVTDPRIKRDINDRIMRVQSGFMNSMSFPGQSLTGLDPIDQKVISEYTKQQRTETSRLAAQKEVALQELRTKRDNPILFMHCVGVNPDVNGE